MDLSFLVGLFLDTKKSLQERSAAEHGSLPEHTIVECLAHLVMGAIRTSEQGGTINPISIPNAKNEDCKAICDWVKARSDAGKLTPMYINFLEYACGQKLGYGDYQAEDDR